LFKETSLKQLGVWLQNAHSYLEYGDAESLRDEKTLVR